MNTPSRRPARVLSCADETIIALLAGILGFGVIAGTAATIAKVCFVIFLVLFIASLFRSSGRRS